MGYGFDKEVNGQITGSPAAKNAGDAGSSKEKQSVPIRQGAEKEDDSESYRMKGGASPRKQSDVDGAQQEGSQRQRDLGDPSPSASHSPRADADQAAQQEEGAVNTRSARSDDGTGMGNERRSAGSSVVDEDFV